MPGISGAVVRGTLSTAFDRQNADRSLKAHRSNPAHGDQKQRRSDYSALGAVRNQEIRAYTGAKSPKADTTTSAISPAVSELRLFRRLPSEKNLITPVTGRRPKTLNIESGSRSQG
jgi:hypothetical protein